MNHLKPDGRAKIVNSIVTKFCSDIDSMLKDKANGEIASTKLEGEGREKVVEGSPASGGPVEDLTLLRGAAFGLQFWQIPPQ